MDPLIANWLESLPEHLGERSRRVTPEASTASGAAAGSARFVLYWLRNAMRADENPALDVARHAAGALGLPLLVYQGLSERYPYASDRHHTFILQGVRDLQRQFRRQGTSYVFHLETAHRRGPHLVTLADQSALVVTEDMPVDPARQFLARLMRRSSTPVVAVDTACVVPMQRIGRAYERAFRFREATRTLYAQRVSQSWPQPVGLAPDAPRAGLAPDASRAGLAPDASRTADPPRDEQPCELPFELPFEPLDLETADLAELVAACEIDHLVGPVAETPGGTEAGYARWNAFLETGLARYASRRNNPLVDGTSRLSPYLHYGMVSPLRIAREAAAQDTPGAAKFLDELLIWRELAYAFCFYRADHESLSALPDWARKTLDQHRADRRPQLPSWETLARGTTGDPLWDAAQQSLLRHGQLHNNVRMTWGKALPAWTPDAESALACMIDLNHRYALDGRDPASYGGILWCLGQFDRPFSPPTPILGEVRGRPTDEHARRLDVGRYQQLTSRAVVTPAPRVAVIGAGISGLICARTLADHGLPVTVFEKSRGAGGRMATRRTESGLRFDHGAQYFTARDPRFRRYVDSWQADGIVAPWAGTVRVLRDGQISETRDARDRFVGVPGMNAICRHLATDGELRFQTQVAAVERQGTRWCLRDAEGAELGGFDYVAVSAPAAQAAVLLQEAAELSAAAGGVTMSGCWAVMLALDSPLDVPFDGAFVHDSPLSWVARNGSKPGRDASLDTWVLHASPEWSAEHLERDAEHVLAELLPAFWEATGLPARRPRHAAAHRWRYALPPEPHSDRCLFDAEQRLGACGDWCGGPRVEGAFLSGAALAGRILGQACAAGRTTSDPAPGGAAQRLLEFPE